MISQHSMNIKVCLAINKAFPLKIHCCQWVSLKCGCETYTYTFVTGVNCSESFHNSNPPCVTDITCTVCTYIRPKSSQNILCTVGCLLQMLPQTQRCKKLPLISLQLKVKREDLKPLSLSLQFHAGCLYIRGSQFFSESWLQIISTSMHIFDISKQ